MLGLKVMGSKVNNSTGAKKRKPRLTRLLVENLHGLGCFSCITFHGLEIASFLRLVVSFCHGKN
jgi:hypothetical protein